MRNLHEDKDADVGWDIQEKAQNGWDDDGGYIELHQIAKGVVHNRYVDHIDHAAEFSPRHHHHGAFPNDIIIHEHGGSDNHDHYLMDDTNDDHPTDFYNNYGPANHTHKAGVPLDRNDPND